MSSKHAYAIIRACLPLDDTDLNSCVAVTKIVRSRREAQREVDRLTAMDRHEGDEDTIHFWQYTRLQEKSSPWVIMFLAMSMLVMLATLGYVVLTVWGS
jgi:cytochrome c biogenesis protein ResB